MADDSSTYSMYPRTLVNGAQTAVAVSAQDEARLNALGYFPAGQANQQAYVVAVQQVDASIIASGVNITETFLGSGIPITPT